MLPHRRAMSVSDKGFYVALTLFRSHTREQVHQAPGLDL